MFDQQRETYLHNIQLSVLSSPWPTSNNNYNYGSSRPCLHTTIIITMRGYLGHLDHSQDKGVGSREFHRAFLNF